MSTRRTRHSAKTKELTQQAFEEIETNIWDVGKPEVYLQFSLLEQFPQLMEPGTLLSGCMKWNNTPRLFKRIPTLPTLTVKPVIWDKCVTDPVPTGNLLSSPKFSVPVYHDKGTPPKMGGGSSFTGTKLP